MHIPAADTDEWITAEGTFDGNPSILRFRPNLKDHLGNPDYPQRLIVTWEYEEEDESGMPPSEESDAMAEFEDILVANLDPERLAILAFVFTTPGRREWHLYMGDVDAVGERINQSLEGYPELPITLEVEEDEEWNELAQILQLAAD